MLQFGNFSRYNEGRVGRHCEWSTDEVDSEEMDAYCRKKNSSEIYSNDRLCLCTVVFVGRGIIQLKFLLSNSESGIISTVINPMA
jgi:hypothetical protein